MIKYSINYTLLIVVLEELMTKKKVSKKKKVNTDVIAVFAILAFIILLGIGVSCFHSLNYNESVKKESATVKSTSLNEEKTLIITLGIVSIITIGIYTTVKIKTSIKKRRIMEEKLKRQREIEAAKKRLNESMYDDILKAGNSVLWERKKAEHILSEQRTGIRHKYDLNNINDYEDLQADSISNRKNNTYYSDEALGADEKQSALISAVKENKSLILIVLGIILVIIIFGIIIYI